MDAFSNLKSEVVVTIKIDSLGNIGVESKGVSALLIAKWLNGLVIDLIGSQFEPSSPILKPFGVGRYAQNSLPGWILPG